MDKKLSLRYNIYVVRKVLTKYLEKESVNMQMSGIVEVKDLAKLDKTGRAMKILCAEISPNGELIWYVLYSTNQRSFNLLKSLGFGDAIHFSGAKLFNLKGFIDKRQIPGATLEIDISNAVLSIQRNMDCEASRGIKKKNTVDKSAVKNPSQNPNIKNRIEEPKESVEAIDFDFKTPKKESALDILSESWEGTDFGLM